MISTLQSLIFRIICSETSSRHALLSLVFYRRCEAKLSDSARTAIESASNGRLISAASFWEMAIKSSLGKLDLQLPFAELASRVLADTGSELLGLSVSHLATLEQLPFHHRDPFDRILVAQAQAEGLTIVSKDKDIQAYDVACVW